jgi:hypothetical protein
MLIYLTANNKGEVVPVLNYLRTSHEGVWGSRCIDPIFLTLALVVAEWSASCPGLFTAGGRADLCFWWFKYIYCFYIELLVVDIHGW